MSRHSSFLLALLITACGRTQAAVAQTAAAGVHLGGILSSLPGAFARYRTTQPRLSLLVGADVRIRFTRALGLQVGVQYAKKGQSLTDAGGGLWLDYVELPVLVALSIPRPLLGATVSGLLGVSPAREVHCHYRDTPPNPMLLIPPPGIQDMGCVVVRSQLVDIGLTGGVEVEPAVAAGHLTLSVRFTQGVRDLAQAGYWYFPVHNRNWSVAVGYRVPIAVSLR
jgi:hypothetical protein